MRYEAPTTLDQALALLASAGPAARVLAGGTDLLVQIRTDAVDPSVLIDIKGIDEVRRIAQDAGGYRIGAAVTGAEMKEHASLKNDWPGLVEGANLIGSTQVQGRATMGGNLCNGSPAADSVPGLIAAGAKVVVAGPKGRREVPVDDIMVGPRKLSIGRDEIIVSFLLPARAPRSADAYLRFIPRTEMDIAVVGCGVSLSLDAAGVCTAARLSLGAVAERPLLVSDAATAMVGRKIDAGVLEKVAAAAGAACRPIDDKRGTKEFRIKVAGVLARRATEIALERAEKKSV